MVTVEEIEAALNLSAERKFDASLALYQEMLIRAQDDQIRMRIRPIPLWLILEIGPQVARNPVPSLNRIPAIAFRRLLVPLQLDYRERGQQSGFAIFLECHRLPI